MRGSRFQKRPIFLLSVLLSSVFHNLFHPLVFCSLTVFNYWHYHKAQCCWSQLPTSTRSLSLSCSLEYVSNDRGRLGATCSSLSRCLPSSGWLILKPNPRPLAQGALLTLCHIQIAPRSACKESLSENGSTVWWLAKSHSKAASAKATGYACVCVLQLDGQWVACMKPNSCGWLGK